MNCCDAVAYLKCKYDEKSTTKKKKIPEKSGDSSDVGQQKNDKRKQISRKSKFMAEQ